MRTFFADKFERDHHLNLNLIRFFEEVEGEDELLEFAIRSFSHILNIHHLWNCRLKQLTSESNDWDILPMSYFVHFQNQNYRETRELIEFTDWDEIVCYHSSEGFPLSEIAMDIMYHVLQHSNYHRAQIIRELKRSGIKVPGLDLILFRSDREVTK